MERNVRLEECPSRMCTAKKLKGWLSVRLLGGVETACNVKLLEVSEKQL